MVFDSAKSGWPDLLGHIKVILYDMPIDINLEHLVLVIPSLFGLFRLEKHAVLFQIDPIFDKNNPPLFKKVKKSFVDFFELLPEGL
jgi:hypothetical protein